MNPRFGLRWTLSMFVLLAVNLAPLIGVFAFRWDVGVIVLLYWAENLVIGAYTITRMVLAPMPVGLFHVGKLFAIPFFLLHFGGFCAVHGLFLMAFFELGGGPDGVFGELGSSGPFIFVELLVRVVRALWEHPPPLFRLLVVGLFASHGVSFVQNYLMGGEREILKIGKLMAQPYKRIFVLHVAIIAGGVPVLLLDSPVVLLIVLVLLKMGLDITLHAREHGLTTRDREVTDS